MDVRSQPPRSARPARVALAVALAAAFAGGTGVLAQSRDGAGRAARPRELPLVFHLGAPYVELELGGARGLFLLDFGANTSGVDAAWLTSAAVPHRSAPGITVGGTTGPISVGRVVVDQLALASGSFRDVVLAAQDFSHFRSPAEGPQVGLLGTDLLNAYQLDLDYRAGVARLALEHERQDPPADMRAARVTYDRGLPTATIRLGGLELPCRLDSGAAWSDPRPILDVNRSAVLALRRAGVALEPAGEVYVTGVGGARRLELLRGRGPGLTLGIGPAHIHEVVLAVHDVGTLAGDRPLTLAGSGVLARLGRLVLDPFDELLWLEEQERSAPL